MTTVWAFTSGSYSDYRVECLFTTRELAIEYAARRSGQPVEWWTRYMDINDEIDALPNRDTKHRRALVGESNTMYCALRDLDYGITTLDLYDSLPAV